VACCLPEAFTAIERFLTAVPRVVVLFSFCLEKSPCYQAEVRDPRFA
jgi:hypothetical protein